VLAIESLESGGPLYYARSSYDIDFIYRLGEYASVDNFETDRFVECGPGIHFYITKQEALDN